MSARNRKHRTGQPARIRIGLILFGLFAGALPLAPGALPARGLPAYSAALKEMPAVWAARYPVEVSEFRPNPGGKGVLRATYKGRYVYYYRFQAIVPRPLRKVDDLGDPDPKPVAGPPRMVEFWARYRPWLKAPWDLSFVREDRLPGRARRWLRVGS